jgi:hypothetical protein
MNKYFKKNNITYNSNFDRPESNIKTNRIVYWGEVISNNDEYESGRLKIRIPDLDNMINDSDLPYSYPFLPKFFHIIPKQGEVVRILLENPDHPQRGRLWMGSIISQLQNIQYDGIYTALSTTHLGVTKPQPSLSQYPDAEDVFPDKDDVALIGRKNNDIILKDNKNLIRVGKHLKNNPLKKNKKNPSIILQDFTNKDKNNNPISENIIMSDKIAIISHDGIPLFRSYDLDNEYKNKIFKDGHPLGRGDVIVKSLEMIRDALIQHIHPYHGVPSDPNDVIIKLQKIDFESILQKNIVIN